MLLRSYGVPIPVIGSLAPTMPRSRCSILGFISLVPVASTHFPRIGLITITGCALLCIWRVKLSTTWSFAVLKELLLFPSGNQPISGPSCVRMVYTGVHLFMTRLSYLIFLIYSLEEKLRTLFLAIGQCISFISSAYWLYHPPQIRFRLFSRNVLCSFYLSSFELLLSASLALYPGWVLYT